MIYVVLANWMTSCGTMNQDSEARIDAALADAVPGHDCFLFPGWDYLADCDVTVASAMRDLFLKKAGSEFRVLLEERSRDTVGDAVFSRATLEKNALFGELCVVTSDYHIDRSRLVFDFVFDDRWLVLARPAPSELTGQEQHEKSSLRSFRRTFDGIEPGDFETIKNRLCERHPFYNGETHAMMSPTSI